ncbi:vWA domain-containing protein [Deinococcus yavapaiensis]|uniref:Ca-activated chloride channel family protein n=1 Tax=Deinococcus yavapaiensis KR-236 TaxID=694435 RepID=A0A318S242_9DEIO|nr:VWA domain-containing protein [Deinococcus yavapaiensis]PYE51996.1 Ca-activated chloride channel family protein [Deinococcus yavapaiensis KR-236]
MHEPRLELLPLHAALRTSHSTDVTLLIRVHAPALPARTTRRVPLNLALVLDRSGSMSGEPLEMAKRAAIAAVRQARADDRLSVVTFDDTVHVTAASQTITNRDAVIAAIERVEAGGSTDLHGGWLEGAMQVAAHVQANALNRVVVLSDGRANHGVTNGRDIARNVRGLTERGVSTTTIGLGGHYDENLLLSMATAGDGSFEHVEDATRLPTFFEEELQGLTRTAGRTVSLGIEPNPEFDVRLMDVLNDFKRNDHGRLQLPNLVAGQVIEVVATLQVPAQLGREGLSVSIANVRLAWTDLEGTRHARRFPVVLNVYSASDADALPNDAVVQSVAAVLRSARYKRDAVRALDQGDRRAARQTFEAASFALLAAPLDAASLSQELADVQALSDALDRGDTALSRKRALSQAHARAHSKPRK